MVADARLCVCDQHGFAGMKSSPPFFGTESKIKVSPYAAPRLGQFGIRAIFSVPGHARLRSWQRAFLPGCLLLHAGSEASTRTLHCRREQRWQAGLQLLKETVMTPQHLRQGGARTDFGLTGPNRRSSLSMFDAPNLRALFAC
eukprot:6179717-Pleurochrysis_carterae.AAC.4